MGAATRAPKMPMRNPRRSMAGLLTWGRYKTFNPLMPAEHQGLDRKHQGVDAQDQRVHQPDGVHGMKREALKSPDPRLGDLVVMAAVGIGDAAASRRDAVEAPFVKGLQEDEDRARADHLLRINELLAAAELAGGDEVLHSGHYEGDDRPRLGHAGGLRDHADLHDLRLDLTEAGLQALPSGAFRNQDARRTHEWVHDVTDAQGELLHASGYAGPNHGFVELHLRLRQSCLSAGLLGRKEGGDLGLGRLFRGGS